MTDQIQVSNALSILSYFSSLLDPISTASAGQRQPSDKLPSKPRDEDVESVTIPPSSSTALSSSTEASESVALSLSNFVTSSISENLSPVVIGLKLPLTISRPSKLPSSPRSDSCDPNSSTTTDRQTLFIFGPVISNRDKATAPVSLSVAQSLDDDADDRRGVFSESSWSVGSDHCSSDGQLNCQKEFMDFVKSEHFFCTRNGSDKMVSDEVPWRDGESTIRISESMLSFPIPFSTINENKFVESHQRQNFEAVVTGFDLQCESPDVQPPPGSELSPSGGSVLSPGNPQDAGISGVGVGASREEKICAVCGDRALGCNFDAVSCESCKAFFRRNAFKEEKIKCLFTGNCMINVNTRRFCSHCRLRRCFEVGMKKDFILGVEEKKRRMEVVKQNRKRRSEEYVSSTTAAATTTAASPSSSNRPVEVAPQNESTNLLTLAKHDPLTSTSAAVNANAGFATASSSLTQTVDSQIMRKLTPEESHMLIDLNQVYDLSFTVDLEPLIHITQLNPSLNQLVNQSSYTVLRMIKFAKRLEDFVKLSQDLQISILKGCWFHLLLLRPVSLFDAERDGWITPKGVIPTDILKNATGYVELHDDHVRYCRSIKSIIGNDVMLLVILLVLVLFAPDGPHVVAREVVSNIQDRYVILLKHYLEAKYTFKRSAHMFPLLLEKIRELDSLVENHAKILMDINPHEIEPIMLEMLDYKN